MAKCQICNLNNKILKLSPVPKGFNFKAKKIKLCPFCIKEYLG